MTASYKLEYPSHVKELHELKGNLHNDKERDVSGKNPHTWLQCHLTALLKHNGMEWLMVIVEEIETVTKEG